MTIMESMPRAGRQRVSDLCRAEWLRIRSGRASLLFVLVIVLLPLVWCYQSASSAQANWASFTASQRASFDPVSSTISGLYLSQVLIGVWAALVLTGEYTSGSIRTTLASAPRRLQLLAAKCLVGAVVMFVVLGVALSHITPNHST